MNLFGPNSNRPLSMQLSDAWYYLKHPVDFYREIWLEWLARRKGQSTWEA